MLECLIIGDSIAVGLSNHMDHCVTQAKGGINTKAWYRHYHEKISIREVAYDTVIISLGSNDTTYIEDDLQKVRDAIIGKKVYWLIPSQTKKHSQWIMVLNVAIKNSDRMIDITPYLGPDNIHPTGKGYKDIAKKIKDY